MTSLRKFLVVAAVALTTIGLGARVGSAAANLTTSLLWTDPPAFPACIGTNVGATPIGSIKVEMVDRNGTVVFIDTVYNLAVGNSFTLIPSVASGYHFCRFTPSVNPINLRANETVFVYDASVDAIVVVGFSEAR